MTASDVREAAATLRGVAHRTPVLRSKTLDAYCGAQIFIKCENFQRMGAFKFRGAYNFLASLTPQQLRRGVVAYSSGNHAQAVALAARLLRAHATIVMPEDAPASKLAATAGYGGEIVLYRRGAEEREHIAKAIAAQRGAVLVPPFDDGRIVAGAGTAAAELLEKSGKLDAIVVPVGGGGLLAGTALAACEADPAIAIYGVEPEKGDDFAQSLHANRRVTIALPATIADGLQTTSPSELTLAIALQHRARVVVVSDRELVEAMRFAFARLKIVVEPSGAAALAALMQHRIPNADGKRVGVILSGGNVDAARYGELMSRL